MAQICLTKELSKAHETIWRDLDQCINDLEADESKQKGEWCLIFRLKPTETTNLSWIDDLKSQGFTQKQCLSIGKTLKLAKRNDIYTHYENT